MFEADQCTVKQLIVMADVVYVIVAEMQIFVLIDSVVAAEFALRINVFALRIHGVSLSIYRLS